MKRLLILLPLALLVGCAAAPRTVPGQWPPLDAALAAPCQLPHAPEAALHDYDARDDYYQHAVLPAFADCAQRKARIVDAWRQVAAQAPPQR